MHMRIIIDIAIRRVRDWHTGKQRENSLYLKSRNVGLILLSVVMMSSLTLLMFGLDFSPGPVQILHLPTTLAQAVFVFWIASRDGIETFLQPLTKFQRLLVLVLSIYVVSVSTFSEAPSAVMFAPAWVVHILFFVALLSYFRAAGPKVATQLWNTLGVAGLIHVSAFLWAWMIWPDAILEGRLPVFDNIRHLGYLAAPAAAVTALAFVARTERALLSLTFFAASLFYLFYTGSRGGVVALAGGIVLMSVFVKGAAIPVLPTRVAMIAVTTLAVVLVSELLPALPWKTIFGRGADALEQTGDELLSGRWKLWMHVVEAVRENWVFGYGPAIMAQISEFHGAPMRHPHNFGLQLLLHWGFAGSLLFAALGVSFAPVLLRSLRSVPCVMMLPLAALTTMLLHALVDGGLYYPFSAAIAIVALGALCSRPSEDLTSLTADRIFPSVKPDDMPGHAPDDSDHYE